VGGWLGYFLGGNDGLLYALLAFVMLDYITGVMCAVADRKGPGTDYDRVQFIPIGVYTIMEVRSGKGSSAGWGRLKSGMTKS